MSVGGLWPWVLALLSLPGKWFASPYCPCRFGSSLRSPGGGQRAWLEPAKDASAAGFILGVPSASRCSGACGTRFSEDLTPEETQTSWDKDIPAINQGLIPEETPESSFLLEGDILRPSPFRLFSATNNKWPKNGGVVEVPFLLSSKYDKPSLQVILEAFAEFERFTCIRFVAYEGQRDFISIVPMSGCFSSIGRSGGMQVVSLGPSCLQRGPGIVLHELMHTHSDGRSPTPASRPYLQQLLKALLAESRSPDPSGFGAEESPRVWKAPALRSSGVEASARPPQPPASSLRSRPGAVVPGIALEQSWQAQVPAVPPDSSLEAEDQPAIV
ncbi:hypothetical protein E2I00_005028 [Balaenoptera physalus]|uniref:Peptidase M12A domain-containing protein n=1 Tax=Balaenoptera physalus TaxID=9770 RepID=A0A6A1Q2Z4_BALPH|nr:hypothetical protein E2I00_005028 [Balaenoptera physalus]